MGNTADSIGKPFAWYDYSDREYSSWKTWQRSLFAEWIPYSESWPRSGQMLNGTSYLLPILVPRIYETAFTYLPTLTARDYRFPGKKRYSERGGGKKGENLAERLGGPINPEFAELHMGFPAGWTE